MKKQPNSLAVYCQASSFSKRVILGIAAYIHSHTDWNILPFEKENNDLRNLELENLVGAIVVEPGICSANLVDTLKRKIPTVVVGCDEFADGLLSFGINEISVANEASLAFFDRGFSELAFVGIVNHRYSAKLFEAFYRFIAKKNLMPYSFMTHMGMTEHIGKNQSELILHQRLGAWLRTLPRNTGILAVNDDLAYEVIKTASTMGFSVPDDFAVIGVNDDDLLCKISVPTISSIRLPFERVGFDAAAALISLTKGKLSQSANEGNVRRVYEPMGFVSRGSTKVVVVKDPVVKAAVTYIHENFENAINVENILEELQVSRSLLERRFREELGVTPLVELRRQRIERARALLSDTNETIHDMGSRCGFSSAIRFTTVFKEQVGMTPTEFRQMMVPNTGK